jgi:diguanylate cyclase (GGDEF)-like protein/PAS domain S-box-containing protein
LKIDFTPSVFFLLAGLPLAFYLLWHGWRNRDRPGAVPFLVLIGLSTAWAVEAAFELLAADLSTKLLWADLQYLSICFIPVALLALALDYTGNRGWLDHRNLGLLSIVPLVMLGLQWTNSHHQLMRASAWLDTTGAHPVIGRTFGPAFWFHSAYSYILIITALAFLLHAVLSSPPYYRKQPGVLLAGFTVPFLWNAFYLLKPGLLPAFDYTPALFGLGELIGAYGLFRFRLFDLVVMARDSLLDNMADGLLVLDEAEVTVDLNDAARALIGLPAKHVIGKPIADTWPAWSQIAEQYRSGTGRAEIALGDEDDRHDYEVKISMLEDKGVIRGRILVLHDITERSALEDHLRTQALTDGLTGLVNRTLFMAKLADLVHTGRRHPDRVFAVISLDIDRFKFINDTIGHLAGDEVLETVANRLKRCVRAEDTVARLGGDEFMILLNELGDMRDVVVVLERVVDEMRTPVYTRQQQLLVSLSAGVVLWDASYHDAEDLLHAADAAMYQAKQAGGGCYRIFDERMHRTQLESVQAEAELRDAVAKESFDLEYQPVVETATGKIVSLEALVRWQHPDRGTLPPTAFMEAAESSGLIVPLGEMILDKICAQLHAWRSRTCPAFELPVSMNVSPRQLTDTDFVGSVLSRMTDWRLSPGSLAFEITETALDRDPVRARSAAKELSALGMRVCLDDFGNGPSSLRHLVDFPGQDVKLDCVLITRMAEGTTELALARSLIDLAHALGLTVTAEGVESKGIWQLLKDTGCDRLQGYYIAEPMNPKVLLEYLEGRRPVASPIEIRRAAKHGS